MQLSNPYYDPELLQLMTGALDAAFGNQRSPDGADGQALRTAMAVQIMTAVGFGERDPERLKLEALSAVNGRAMRC